VSDPAAAGPAAAGLPGASLAGASLVEAYRRDGAVVVRGLVDAALLADLRAAIDANLADPSALAITASAPDDPGRFVEDFCNWRRFPAYEAAARSPRIAATAAALLGARQIRLYHDHLLVKEAGTRHPTPWHQDQPYYNVDGQQVVSLWLPVDPVPEPASLAVVAGTHAGPWLLPRSFLDRQARWFPEGALADLPDYDADLAADPSSHRVLRWALDPGDGVFFSALAVHGAAGAASGERRRVLSLRFLGDDARHAPRPWRTSPPFPGLADRLPPGEPFDHPDFPVVWPPAGTASAGARAAAR
jgi:ectoine hydroxylase-related dioxygenase (phytanoyl-CoA dioxygenase family)